MQKACGTFEVDIEPAAFSFSGEGGINLGRMLLKKSFTGDLFANSKGEMLSVMTEVQGSAGYVAIEQVTGSLNGMQGSFVLQHFGMMDKGEDRLILEVVPDSAMGELAGLSGQMAIRMENGQHNYEFKYVL